MSSSRLSFLRPPAGSCSEDTWPSATQRAAISIGREELIYRREAEHGLSYLLHGNQLALQPTPAALKRRKHFDRTLERSRYRNQAMNPPISTVQRYGYDQPTHAVSHDVELIRISEMKEFRILFDRGFKTLALSKLLNRQS